MLEVGSRTTPRKTLGLWAANTIVIKRSFDNVYIGVSKWLDVPVIDIIDTINPSRLGRGRVKYGLNVKPMYGPWPICPCYQ